MHTNDDIRALLLCFLGAHHKVYTLVRKTELSGCCALSAFHSAPFPLPTIPTAESAVTTALFTSRMALVDVIILLFSRGSSKLDLTGI